MRCNFSPFSLVLFHKQEMNREEYNHAVVRFSDDVYRFVYKTCRSRELAEDVVQDSYTRLWEALSSVSHEKVKAFLFTTAYHRVIDILRREKRYKEMETLELHAGACATSHVDLQKTLDAALYWLSGIQRTVLLLRDYEGYSYDEIASLTGLTPSSVKVYIFRVRMTMRASLGSPREII